MDRRLSLAVPSQTKAKAIDEARKTQAAVLRDCAAARCDPPPYVLSELIGKGSFGRVFKATTTARGAAPPSTIVAVKIISIEEGDAAATDAGAASVAVNAPPPTISLLGPTSSTPESTSSVVPASSTAQQHAQRNAQGNAQQASAAGVVDTFGDVLKEIRTLQLLGASGARNINTVLDSLLVGPAVWMVTEYCAGGSVATLMRPTGHLPEKWIVPILREVAEALFWVHGQGIIHRDIKCANVLVAESEPGPGGVRTVHSVQLCDFGVAGFVETAVDKRRTVTGTLHWMAPELFHTDVAYGTEVDIWAFGSMAYEVASGLPPNATMSGIDISTFGSYLEQNCPRLIGSQYSNALKDLVALCMVHDPKQRPSIEKVQRFRYIAGTANTHPTTSLSTLLSAYRLWQARGGGRLSLFSAGGARGVADVDPGVRLPDWDFSDGDDEYDFDNDADNDDDDDDNDLGGSFSLDYEANTLAVYEAYGISLDKSPSLPPTPRQLPPPPPPPPQSRLRRRLPPTMQRSTVPLERVFNPNTLTNYRDKARAVYGRLPPPGLSPSSASDLPLRGYSKELDRESLIDLDLSIVDQGSSGEQADDDTIRPHYKPSTSVDVMRHRTQDWTFPAAAKSPTNEATAIVEPQWKMHQGDDLAAVDASRKRVSTVSLINLDDATGAGSDNEDTPFEFDTDRPRIRHKHEPSLYVSDATNTSGQQSTLAAAEANGAPRTLPLLLPSVPMAPASQVLQGVATRNDTRDELLRMLSSLGEHLHMTTQTLEGLPMHAMRKSYAGGEVQFE